MVRVRSVVRVNCETRLVVGDSIQTTVEWDATNDASFGFSCAEGCRPCPRSEWRYLLGPFG